MQGPRASPRVVLAALVAGTVAALAAAAPIELAPPVYTTVPSPAPTASASPPPPDSPSRTPSRSPHGTPVARGNAYVAPSGTQDARVAPSVSARGYVQFAVVIALDGGVAAVAPCRSAPEWLLQAGGGAALRALLAKLAGLPLGDVALASVDDGWTAVVDGSPALAWANAVASPPQPVDLAGACNPTGVSLSRTPAPGAAPSPYGDSSGGSGTGDAVVVIGVRAFGNGTAASLRDVAAAVAAVESGQLAARFGVVGGVRLAGVSLSTDPTSAGNGGGGLVVVSPSGALAGASSPGAGASVGGSGAPALGGGVLAGVVIGAIVGAALAAALVVAVLRTARRKEAAAAAPAAGAGPATRADTDAAAASAAAAAAARAAARLKRHLRVTSSGGSAASVPGSTPSSAGSRGSSVAESPGGSGGGAGAYRLRSSPRWEAATPYTFR